MAASDTFSTAPIEYLPPRLEFDASSPAPRYYEWSDVFPFLQPVLDAREKIFAELRAATGMTKWFDWPETELYSKEEGHTWHPYSALFAAGTGHCADAASGLGRLEQSRAALPSTLYVPPGDVCGMVVEDEVRYHRLGDILMFDDSKVHYAFNHHARESRYVLIFDIVRPAGLPLGLATGSTTDELQGFMAYFK